jgi:hypothetical protein
MNTTSGPAKPTYETSRVIGVVLPDDGTDLDLIRALRDEKNVIASTAVTCRGIGILESVRDAAKGKLPPSELVRLLTVIVPDSQAKDLFEFIYEKANIEREAGGGVWMGMPISATRYTLPSDVPDEKMRTRHNEE